MGHYTAANSGNVFIYLFFTLICFFEIVLLITGRLLYLTE